jgi:colanic acid biosynthesis glycosyl transferase WcaI
MIKNRVLLLTQWFDPEPTFKGIVFARELVNQGFCVEVITGFPNYPGGQIYDGYRIRFIQREVIDGVFITRVPLYPSHGQSATGRILNYLSFSISSTIYGIFFAKRADILYAYQPPITVGIAACLINLFRGIPIVYDIQDMWPDTLKATGMINSQLILRIVGIACDFVYKRVSYITVLSNGFSSLLIGRGVPEEKIQVIYNWADETSLTCSDIIYPDNFPGNNNFRILFAGNMGKAQCLETVLDAAYILKDKLPQVCFILLGGGVELTQLKKISVRMKLNNVFFLPAVPMSHVNNYLQAADVLLVHLSADPLFRITIPSKTQAYMASGKPILMAVDGDAANLIEKAQCGVTAKSQDPNDIARAVTYLASLKKNDLRKLGKNGRDYYESHLSLKVGVAQFAQIFRSVIK